MKLYLAGPMSGYENHNYPLFTSEAKRLRDLGFEIVNPAEINAESGNISGITPPEIWLACMREDIKQLVDCDGIACLPNYMQSKGASVEVKIMQMLNLPVYIASEIYERN